MTVSSYAIISLGFLFGSCFAANVTENSTCDPPMIFDTCQCVQSNGSDTLKRLKMTDLQREVKLKFFRDAATQYHIEKIRVEAYQDSIEQCRKEKKSSEEQLSVLQNRLAIVKADIDDCRLKASKVDDFLEDLSTCFSPAQVMSKKIQRKQKELDRQTKKLKYFQQNQGRSTDCRAMVMITKVRINFIKTRIENLVQEKNKKVENCKKIEEEGNKQKKEFETSCPTKVVDAQVVAQATLQSSITKTQATIVGAENCIANGSKKGGRELRKLLLSRSEDMDTALDEYISQSETVRRLWTDYCFLKIADRTLCADKEEATIMQLHDDQLKEALTTAKQDAEKSFVKPASDQKP